MLDKAIAIAIMLFILSMISERLVTWIKLYFGQLGKALWLFSDESEDLTIASANQLDEKKKERKILGLNIVVGLLIAFLSHADLFSIFNSEPPYKSLGWDNVHFVLTWLGFANLLQLLLGCILSGFFISLGSKFWHDMLDMLLYAKNLKGKLSDSQTYEATSTDQLTEYLSFSESDLVRLAIEQNSQVLKTKFPNIQYLNDSIAIIKGERKDILSIYIKDKNINGIPDKVPVKLPSGKTYNVGTEIVQNTGVAKVSGGMDGSVSNSTSQGYTGSACCVAKDQNGDQFMITNCHVLTAGDLNDPLDETGDDGVYYNNDIVGKWSLGIMDEKGDFALVLLNDADDFISNNNVERFENRFKDITKADFFSSVTVRGNISHKVGYIVDVVSNQIGIQYNYGKTIVFDNAILLGSAPDKQTCGQVTDFGDSGGAVFNENNELVGIITGIIDGRFTLVLPVRDFANIHSLQIV